MANNFLTKIFGSRNDRLLKQYRRTVEQINAFEPRLEQLSDEQLLRLVPRAWRDYFPGKDACANGSFYLHDGTAWSFYKGGFVDE